MCLERSTAVPRSHDPFQLSVSADRADDSFGPIGKSDRKVLSFLAVTFVLVAMVVSGPREWELTGSGGDTEREPPLTDVQYGDVSDASSPVKHISRLLTRLA